KSSSRSESAKRSRRPSAGDTSKRGRQVLPALDDDEVDAAPVFDADGETPLPPSDKNPRFEPGVDRRIIEGMLHDRETLMAEMSEKAISRAAVRRRAAELGLSEALIRQVKGVAADLAGERPGRRNPPPSLGARTCLCCDRVFLSAGPGNRLCMRCRGGDA